MLLRNLGQAEENASLFKHFNGNLKFKFHTFLHSTEYVVTKKFYAATANTANTTKLPFTGK
jgi:hypothetical protein